MSISPNHITLLYIVGGLLISSLGLFLLLLHDTKGPSRPCRRCKSETTCLNMDDLCHECVWHDETHGE